MPSDCGPFKAYLSSQRRNPARERSEKRVNFEATARRYAGAFCWSR